MVCDKVILIDLQDSSGLWNEFWAADRAPGSFTN